jgi:hypothetical protein
MSSSVSSLSMQHLHLIDGVAADDVDESPVVSMQRLSATNAVTPKARIINSCTVDHWTVFMLIMETQVSKLTLVCVINYK